MIKPGSRPTKKNWCEWLRAVLAWEDEDIKKCYERSHKAWLSKSISAQYAALAEMRYLDKVMDGSEQHSHHCSCGRNFDD